MSTAHRRDTERALLGVLDDMGIRDWAFEHGGKHLKLRIYLPGAGRLTLFLAQSPSDRRGVANARCRLRRLLQQRMA